MFTDDTINLCLLGGKHRLVRNELLLVVTKLLAEKLDHLFELTRLLSLLFRHVIGLLGKGERFLCQ